MVLLAGGGEVQKEVNATGRWARVRKWVLSLAVAVSISGCTLCLPETPKDLDPSRMNATPSRLHQMRVQSEMSLACSVLFGLAASVMVHRIRFACESRPVLLFVSSAAVVLAGVVLEIFIVYEYLRHLSAR